MNWCKKILSPNFAYW